MGKIINYPMGVREQELEEDLENYRQALRDAEEALASAERELAAELEARSKSMKS